VQNPLGLSVLLLIVGVGGPTGSPATGSTRGASSAASAASSASGASAAKPATSPACLTAIRLVNDGEQTRLEFEMSRAASPTVRRIESTNLLICEFGDCLPDPALANQTFSNRHVRAIHFSRQNQNLIVQVQLAAPSIISVAGSESAPPRLVVSLADGARAAAAPVDSAREAAKQEGAPAAPPAGAAPAKALPPARSNDKSETSEKAEQKSARQTSAKKSSAVGSQPADDLLAGLPSPKGKATFISLGEKAIADGEVDRGLAYLEAAAGTQKAEAKRDLLLRVARRASREGLFAQSIRCYRRAIANKLPDSLTVPVRAELGSVFLAKGDAARALATWDSALVVAGDGDGHAVRRARADALLSLGRADEALDDLRSLARRGRDEAEEAYAGYRLGVELSRAGKSDEASAAFEQMPSIGPASADSTTAYFVRTALVRRGDILFRSKTPEAAVPIYERVVKGWDGTAEAAWALFQIGNVLRRTGKFAEAEARYQELIARWPDSRWTGLARWGAGESASLARTFGPGGETAPTSGAAAPADASPTPTSALQAAPPNAPHDAPASSRDAAPPAGPALPEDSESPTETEGDGATE